MQVKHNNARSCTPIYKKSRRRGRIRAAQHDELTVMGSHQTRCIKTPFQECCIDIRKVSFQNAKKNLIAMASTQVAMNSNLTMMASNLLVTSDGLQPKSDVVSISLSFPKSLGSKSLARAILRLR